MVMEAPQQVDTVVLAGSVNRIELFLGNPPGFKALVEMHGRPLIAYALDALHEAKTVGRVIVVAHRDVHAFARKWPKVECVPDGHTLVRNAWRGLHWAQTERVLFCNPDQPLLKPHMIDWFVEHALREDADLVSSWVRAETLGRYVEGDHKFADFADGRYAHGNLFLIRKDFPDLEEVRRRMDRLYAARKNNFQFAWELGPKLFSKFVVALALHRLPALQETLDTGAEHFGMTMRAVVSPHPEIVLDIDEPEDYAAAAKYLAQDLVLEPPAPPEELDEAEAPPARTYVLPPVPEP